MRDPSFPSAGSGLPAFAPAIGLREVLEAAPDLIFCCDSSGRFAWASSAFESFAGYRASDLVGQFVTRMLAPEDRLRMVRVFTRQMRQHRAQSGGTFTLLRPDGSRAEVTARVRLYERPDGDRYFIGVAHESPAVESAPVAAAPAMAPIDTLAPEPVAHDTGDVALLEARVGELQLQLDEAREGDRMKHEVLATLSQEIRPPMDTVLGTAAELLASPLSPDQRRQIETIQSASQTLLSLVSDAYDHAQLESGQMAIESMPFDLRVTAGQVAGALGAMAAANGLEFDVRVEPLVPSRLKGDPGRLRQVLLNLGGNAIRHADSGRVEIRMERESEDDSLVTLLFRVRDPGTSPSAERRALVFRERGEGVPAMPSSPDLGLSVSRRLVHLMGGLVGVEADADDGRTFWFRLTFEKQPHQVVAPAAAVRLRGVRVLLADGMPNERRQHAEIVSAWGCDLTECENGIEALDQIRAAAAEGRPYTVALVDMALDGLDGESLVSAVRADEALAATRLVLTTRLGRPGDAMRAREVGCAGYLVKPLDAAQLFDALTELVNAPATAASEEERPLVTRHSLAEARRARVRVLLVEDDAVNQLVTKSALNRVGFHVEVATSGREAIMRTEGEPWDLVLMDVQMPDLDGVRTTLAIRARDRGPWRMPIVGLDYGSLSTAERERCLAAGMDDVFDRPADLAELTAAVERWTQRTDGRELGNEDGSEHEATGKLTVVSGHFDPPAAMLEPVLPPLPEVPAGPAIDLERLNRSSMGLPALRTSMLHTFVTDVAPRLQRFEEAIVARDLVAAEAEALRLRRMSTTVGAGGCASLFEIAEEWAQQGQCDALVRLLPMIQQEVDRAAEFVTRLERITSQQAA